MIDTLSRDTLDPRYDGSPRSAVPLPRPVHRVVVHRPGSPRAVLTSLVPARAAVAASPSVPPPSEQVPPRPRGQAPVARPIGQLRLTRRGRLTVLISALALLFVVFSAGHEMSNAASSPATPPATHTVVVAPGDTFWSLARAAMPHVDGRVAVDRLMTMNHSDGTLQVGQTLVVPGN
jgi:LysM domain